MFNHCLLVFEKGVQLVYGGDIEAEATAEATEAGGADMAVTAVGTDTAGDDEDDLQDGIWLQNLFALMDSALGFSYFDYIAVLPIFDR